MLNIKTCFCLFIPEMFFQMSNQQSVFCNSASEKKLKDCQLLEVTNLLENSNETFIREFWNFPTLLIPLQVTSLSKGAGGNKLPQAGMLVVK